MTLVEDGKTDLIQENSVVISVGTTAMGFCSGEERLDLTLNTAWASRNL